MVGAFPSVLSADLERFMEYVLPEPMSGCWLWIGSISPSGYGKFWLAGRTVRAHRAGYEMLVGPIPPGKELDHLCRVRSCVRLRDLEPVPGIVNKLRSPLQLPTILSAKQACPAGHPYDAANTYRRPGGGRGCRECRRQAVNSYAARRRAGVGQ